MKKRLIAYLKLIRFDKPVGTYLILWPTLTALWCAAGGFPGWRLLSIFTAGAFCMRSAGCVINDIADRHVDKHVARTKFRPLTSGVISLSEAIAVLIVFCGLSLVLVLQLPFVCLWLAIPTLLTTLLYPFCKRFIHAPQLVLGLAFAWAIPMAYAAVLKQLPPVLWLLFSAVWVWTFSFDTMYALVDKADDLKIGVKSTAIILGHFDKLTVAACQVAVLVLYGRVAVIYQKGICFIIAWCAALLLMVYLQYLIKDREPDKCFRAFLLSHWVTFVLGVGLVL